MNIIINVIRMTETRENTHIYPVVFLKVIKQKCVIYVIKMT